MYACMHVCPSPTPLRHPTTPPPPFSRAPPHAFAQFHASTAAFVVEACRPDAAIRHHSRQQHGQKGTATILRGPEQRRSHMAFSRHNTWVLTKCGRMPKAFVLTRMRRAQGRRASCMAMSYVGGLMCLLCVCACACVCAPSVAGAFYRYQLRWSAGRAERLSQRRHHHADGLPHHMHVCVAKGGGCMQCAGTQSACSLL